MSALRSMRLVPALVLVLVLGAAPGHAAGQVARGPRFALHALGVLGGDVDTNLSCYLLGEPGQAPTVMVDGGSVVDGLLKWKQASGALQPEATWGQRFRVAAEALRPVQAACITHAHMDHVGGFIQKTTLDLFLSFQGRKPLEIIALPVTIASLRDHLLRPPLWVDFTKLPADNPALKLAPLSPGAIRAAGPFTVQTIAVNHPDGGAAFLFERDGFAYLHVGDTGRCAALWKPVRPLFKEGRLRAITLECSWPAASEKLAVTTGHLTPASFVLELNELAGVARELPPADKLTREQIRDLARKLARAFQDCPVIVTHIKAADHDQTVEELEELRRVGLNLIIPEQGKSYAF